MLPDHQLCEKNFQRPIKLLTRCTCLQHFNFKKKIFSSLFGITLKISIVPKSEAKIYLYNAVQIVCKWVDPKVWHNVQVSQRRCCI